MTRYYLLLPLMTQIQQSKVFVYKTTMVTNSCPIKFLFIKLLWLLSLVQSNYCLQNYHGNKLESRLRFSYDAFWRLMTRYYLLLPLMTQIQQSKVFVYKTTMVTISSPVKSFFMKLSWLRTRSQA